MPHEPQGRWRRIEALFAAALAQPPESRAEFLDSATGGEDPTIRSEVLALLQAHEQTGAIDRLQEGVSALTASLRPKTLEGELIGHYRVEARVGGGGMGVVYRALDVRLDRPVALKFLAGHLDADPVAHERFRIEARTIAALDHPNICTLHDVGETVDGLHYLVMPFYQGSNIQGRLADAALPVGEAVGIAIQVLRGLGMAHAHGIIHRDIKPSNVFVTTEGVIKVLDFGVAKLADMAITGAGSSPVGTMAYMSPEQALGRTLDLRTDLWSTGVMLYEMLSGKRPYSSGLAAAIVGKEGHESLPSLSALNEQVSPALEQVIAKALDREPAARYQSAGEFEQALLGLGITTGTMA